MRLTTTITILLVLLSACAATPEYNRTSNGRIIEQPGVTLTLPQAQSWAAIHRTTYEALFGAYGNSKDETFVVAVTVYNLPYSPNNREEFLQMIKAARADEPKTSRFEEVSNSEKLYSARKETCVLHQSKSKDFGARAKRGGEYSIYQTYGMNCVHPIKTSVGILVELSRKAPPEDAFPEFGTMGESLLESVMFGEF